MAAEYYKVTFDDSNPEALVCHRYSLKGFDRYLINRGRLITDWPSGVTLYYTEGHPEDFLGNALGWLICSARVRRVFSQLQVSDVQFLPVSVVNERTGKQLCDYTVINILSVIRALDRTHAVCQVDPTYPNFPIIIKVALSSVMIHDKDMFRLQEQVALVFISQRLKKGLEAARTTGLKFIPVPVF